MLSPRVLATRSLYRATTVSIFVSALAFGGCSSGDGGPSAGPFDRDAGMFGEPASEGDGEQGDSDTSGSDGGSGVSGPSVQVRVVHGIPNAGALVLCRFKDLELDDLGTPDIDELERAHAPGTLLGDPALQAGIRFGEVSGWFSVPIDDTGVLSLHRVAVTPPDGGAPGDGGLDAGVAADASLDGAVLDAGGEAELPATLPDPCDPQSLEVALPLPLPDGWLNPPPLPPLLALDAGLFDASAPSSDASSDAAAPGPGDDAGIALPTVAELLAARGISSSLPGGQQVTLFASGLALSPVALKQRAADATTAALTKNPGDATGAALAGSEAVAAIDRAVGPRLLINEVAKAPESGFNLSLAHLVPDLAVGTTAGSGTSGPGAVRACITIDGVVGSAVPSRAAPAVGFREHILLATELSARSSYRIRVFAADDFSAAGQDCANTTRAPLGELQLSPNGFSPGRSYSLVLAGLASPESLCAAGNVNAGVARPGCFGAGDHTTKLFAPDP